MCHRKLVMLYIYTDYVILHRSSILVSLDSLVVCHIFFMIINKNIRLRVKNKHRMIWTSRGKPANESRRCCTEAWVPLLTVTSLKRLWPQTRLMVSTRKTSVSYKVHVSDLVINIRNMIVGEPPSGATSGGRPGMPGLRYPMKRNSTGGSSRNSRLSSFQQSTRYNSYRL